MGFGINIFLLCTLPMNVFAKLYFVLIKFAEIFCKWEYFSMQRCVWFGGWGDDGVCVTSDLLF